MREQNDPNPVVSNTTTPSPKPTASNPTEADLVSAPAHLEAENHNLRQRVAIAERDLEGAKADVDSERARIAQWQDAFGVHDAEDPKEKVRATIDALDAKTKRVASLQAALGVGDEEDPQSAVAALRAPAESKAGALPAWGQLLLLTQLAKHHPLLGASYYATPDVLQDANGDRWTALRQESTQGDGTAGHVVTVQRVPSTYRYDEARTQKVHYDGELAVALRARQTAERAASANLAPAAKKAAQDRLRTARTRVEEVEAALRDLEPCLVAPEPTEWRYVVDLDGLAPVGA